MKNKNLIILSFLLFFSTSVSGLIVNGRYEGVVAFETNYKVNKKIINRMNNWFYARFFNYVQNKYDIFCELRVIDNIDNTSDYLGNLFFTGFAKYMNYYFDTGIFYKANWIFDNFDDPLVMMHRERLSGGDPKMVQGVFLNTTVFTIPTEIIFSESLTTKGSTTNSENTYQNVSMRSYRYLFDTFLKLGGIYQWAFFPSKEMVENYGIDVTSTMDIFSGKLKTSAEYVLSKKDENNLRKPAWIIISKYKWLHYSLMFNYHFYDSEFIAPFSYPNIYNKIEYYAKRKSPRNQKGGGSAFTFELKETFEINAAIDFYSPVKSSISTPGGLYINPYINFIFKPFPAFKTEWIYNSIFYKKNKIEELAFIEILLKLTPRWDFISNFKVQTTDSEKQENLFYSLVYNLNPNMQFSLNYGDNGNPEYDYRTADVSPGQIGMSTIKVIWLKFQAEF